MSKIKEIITLLRWYTTPVPINAVASAFILARDFDITKVLLACISVCFVLFFTNAVNFFYDMEEDKLHPMTSGENAYARGALSPIDMKFLAVLYFAGSLVTAFPIGIEWMFEVFLGDLFGFSYSVWPIRMKRKSYGWFISGNLAIPLAFLFAYATATSSFNFPLSIILVAIFIYLTMTLHLVKDIPDMKADKSVGDRTFPVAYEVKVTRNVIVFAALLALLSFTALTIIGITSVLGLPFFIAIIILVVKWMSVPLEKLKDRMFVYMNLMLKANGTTIPIIFLSSVIAKTLVGF